jgi:hypothetical protein
MASRIKEIAKTTHHPFNSLIEENPILKKAKAAAQYKNGFH